jgi:NAD dependent epimerase/dehydratase family enzyme
MTTSAINAAPSEPAYRITLIRMLVVLGQKGNAQSAMKQLELLNYGGRLDSTLAELRAMPGMQ